MRANKIFMHINGFWCCLLAIATRHILLNEELVTSRWRLFHCEIGCGNGNIINLTYIFISLTVKKSLWNNVHCSVELDSLSFVVKMSLKFLFLFTYFCENVSTNKASSFKNRVKRLALLRNTYEFWSCGLCCTFQPLYFKSLY